MTRHREWLDFFGRESKIYRPFYTFKPSLSFLVNIQNICLYREELPLKIFKSFRHWFINGGSKIWQSLSWWFSTYVKLQRAEEGCPIEFQCHILKVLIWEEVSYLKNCSQCHIPSKWLRWMPEWIISKSQRSQQSSSKCTSFREALKHSPEANLKWV